MKKTLALLLALLLALSLGTVALAVPSLEKDVLEAGLEIENCEIDRGDFMIHMLPGESYSIPMRLMIGINPTDPTSSTGIGDNDIALDAILIAKAPSDYLTDSEDNTEITPDKAWKVSADWDIGGAMVNAVKWDSDYEYPEAFNEALNIENAGAFVVKLNENYTISAPKKLEGTITFTSKIDKKASITFPFVAIVSNHLITVDGYKKAADAKDNVVEAQNNTLYQCDEDNPGYVAFNDGRLLSCVLKMVKNEKAFMYNDEAMLDAVEEKYGDTDARIDCYSFGGSPKFTNDAAFTLQADYADQYKVYTWDGTALHPQKYAWNSVDGVYEWTTKAPTNYVIADKELLAGAETADTAKDAAKNPDTGANDLVGVAAALAVVSLVAGAAVSLKK